MKNYWWVVVILGALMMVIAFDGIKQVKAIESCKQQRIIPLSEKYFTFAGIYELVSQNAYQPKCI